MSTAVAPLVEQVAERARTEPGFAEVLDAILGAPTTPQGTLERVAAHSLNDERRSALVHEFVEGSLATPKVQQRLALRSPQPGQVAGVRRRKPNILSGLAIRCRPGADRPAPDPRTAECVHLGPAGCRPDHAPDARRAGRLVDRRGAAPPEDRRPRVADARRPRCLTFRPATRSRCPTLDRSACAVDVSTPAPNCGGSRRLCPLTGAGPGFRPPATASTRSPGPSEHVMPQALCSARSGNGTGRRV